MNSTAIVMIYKDDQGRWTTDIRGARTLLCAMTDNVVRLADGTTVGRWHWDTWEDAREFIFGAPYRNNRGWLAVRQRAWTLLHREYYP